MIVLGERIFLFFFLRVLCARTWLFVLRYAGFRVLYFCENSPCMSLQVHAYHRWRVRSRNLRWIFIEKLLPMKALGTQHYMIHRWSSHCRFLEAFFLDHCQRQGRKEEKRYFQWEYWGYSRCQRVEVHSVSDAHQKAGGVYQSPDRLCEEKNRYDLETPVSHSHRSKRVPRVHSRSHPVRCYHAYFHRRLPVSIVLWGEVFPWDRLRRKGNARYDSV